MATKRRVRVGIHGAVQGVGCRPFVQQVPPNDGGISLGQVAVAGAHLGHAASSGQA
ncbi:MAG: hypothetical protein ACE5F6_11905 [Anaerolineae bacterium]